MSHRRHCSKCGRLGHNRASCGARRRVTRHKAAPKRRNPVSSGKYKRLWIQKVKTKWHPQPGLFAKGTALHIARAALDGHGGDAGAAIRALQFYINRGGSKLPKAQKGKVKLAQHYIKLWR